LLPADATVQQAIRNLDDSALQIALVVSPGGALLGTITDGDIRRGLLRGLDLNSQIASRDHRGRPPAVHQSRCGLCERSASIGQRSMKYWCIPAIDVIESY
jgi:hypothetical protein